MKKFQIIFILLSNAAIANPIDTNCPMFSIYGAPVLKSDANTQYICRKGYSLNYDKSRKVSNFVLEHLTNQSLTGSEKRKNTFLEDPEVAVRVRSKLSDYSGSSYDRGHMAPAGDFVSSEIQLSESFILTNIMPQNPTLNRGLWKQLEERIRDMTKEGELYIITGTVYKSNYKTIGHGVAVPDAMYKIIIQPKTGKQYAVLMPNMVIHGELNDYVTTVSEIEKQTGINFSPKLIEKDDELIRLNIE